ncbi:serine protein [Diaporthe amygdali]|uniref:serine protein n=1 Tax=Phomopsis amygdali TaxID=1214568 RepID=UPI0022FF1378|nr:serine protein [Diaporthe amygdali]KAJ0119910.1 serine protein [Diaporthe amygdali]
MMLRRLILSVVATLPRSAIAASPPSQKPLLDDAQVNDQVRGREDQPSPWTLNFTSPAPHLFASVPSLLHQWSNTIFPNGHTLAAVEIPTYALFYHGLISPDEPNPTPPSPEWLAFDLEMAYGIMGSTRNSFLLTYQTTRPVKALYFDGESAALMGLGQMDTQMLQLFGNVSGPPGNGFMGLGQEYMRAHGLCQWFEDAMLGGRGWGFEGVVRMNAGFEMIWCDFSSPSLRLVSRLNVTAPLLPEEEDGEKAVQQKVVPENTSPWGVSVVDRADDIAPTAIPSRKQDATSYYPLPPQPTRSDRDSQPSHPAAPPNWRHDPGREPFLRIQGWGWFDSATWHFGSTRNGPGQGEVKAKVLSCGLLSYYSPQFANQSFNRALDERKSLNLTADGLWTGPGEQGNRTNAIKQLARRRRFHHLEDVVSDEAMLMRENSERALRSLLEPQSNCTGADWVLITSEIVKRTTNHLTMVDTKLVSFPWDSQNETTVSEWLYDLRAQIHLFMVGYLEYPPRIEQGTWSTQSKLYGETYSRCKYRYTRLLVPEELHASLSPEEEDIRLAVEDVYGTICSVLLTVGFGVEQAWFESIAGKRPESSTPAAVLGGRADQWHDNIAELQAWLGWESEYYGCEQMCAWDERCYIPMWPLMHMGGGPGRGPGGRPGRGPYPGRPGRGRGPPPGEGPGGGPGDRHPPGDDDGGLPSPPPPERNGTRRGRPGPREPRWMGDDTDLWEPKCVSIDYIMGQR